MENKSRWTTPSCVLSPLYSSVIFTILLSAYIASPRTAPLLAWSHFQPFRHFDASEVIAPPLAYGARFTCSQMRTGRSYNSAGVFSLFFFLTAGCEKNAFLKIATYRVVSGWKTNSEPAVMAMSSSGLPILQRNCYHCTYLCQDANAADDWSRRPW